MKPDYAKATAELIERLRNKKTLPTIHARPVIDGSQVYINAPRDCVIFITPAPQPPSDRDKPA